jgi:APA family basic amino acid/polyamine antiporter
MDVTGLKRSLGLFDAVVIGLGSMIGAGIFVALGPAADVAGSGLLLALGVAAVIAFANATSTARLAALYPASGGTYVYGRERLGPFWGYLAGWAFIVGKTASCAAMALTVGLYVWPQHANAVAATAVVVLTAVNYLGVQKAAWLTRAIVAVVLAVLCAVSVASFTGPASAQWTPRSDGATATGVLQGAGLLFFAFAGYARVATLGEEVRDPARTIPRAVVISLGITLLIYGLVALAALRQLGPEGLAASPNPLLDVVRLAGAPSLAPLIQVGAANAALGSLLALILGVSRTTLAMARDHYLPTSLAAVHPRFQVPHRAEVVVGLIVAIVAGTSDVREAIGFSSFGVLVYYAIANASALTLTAAERRPARPVPLVGLVGCLVVAFLLPVGSVLAGLGVLAVGAVAFGLTRGGRQSTAAG